MAKINTGGPAFPVLSDREYERSNGNSAHALDLDSPGMSLRDWFAGQAMHALLCNPVRTAEAIDAEGNKTASMAAMAYSFADFMLAERAKE